MAEQYADFPAKLKPLVVPHRYKVVRGGRGSGKSWGFARTLLLLGAEKKLRILCAREVQDSIKQSVHKLLKDQIQLLNLGTFYKVLDTEIRGVNGTEFAFTGLSALTVETIKSFEGYDICWVEEGQSISDGSWKILIPTIRKDNSEIWISFNPDMETDPTYERFVTEPPPDTINIIMNWRDNPWFNDVMDQERLHCKKTDPEGYKNIWEGECKPAVQGAIYYKEIQELEAENRICNIPYDPLLKVHLVMDLGWGDSLSIAFIQKNLSEIRIINYLEYNQTKLDVLSNELKNLGYNWGKIWLPHDGFAKTLNSGGKSTYDILKALGWKVAGKEEIIQLSIEEGIRIARMKFKQCYFDKDLTAGQKITEQPGGQTLLTHRLLESLKRYRRKINRETQIATIPVHDEFCFAGDTLIRTFQGWKKIENLVGKSFGLWSYSCTEHRLVPNRAVRCWKAKISTEIAVVTLDNNDVIECTPNHKFMMRDETWCEASSLKPWDSLMPFYENQNGHKKIHLNDGTIAIEHRYIYSRMIGILIDNFHVHHKDGKKWNNEPYNLEQLSPSAHCAIHSKEPERLAKLNKNKNTVCSEASRKHLIQMNKKRAGAGHHTKDPAYWTKDRKISMKDRVVNYYKKTEAEKICPSCGGAFIGNYKRIYCCDNCKAAATRKRRGGKSNFTKKQKHTKDCLLISPNNHKVKSVVILEKQIPVYDIEVENYHNFIANGVVVHNSHAADCFRYIALNIDVMTNDDDWIDYNQEFPGQYETADTITGY